MPGLDYSLDDDPSASAERSGKELKDNSLSQAIADAPEPNAAPATPPRGTPTKRSQTATPPQQLQKKGRTDTTPPRSIASPTTPPHPLEESTHANLEDDDDESMHSYDTTNDQPEDQIASHLDFELDESSFQGPPTIAHLPTDNVFEELEQ